MKKCKSCGAKVAKSAKNCPRCGAKLEMSEGLKFLIIIISLIALVSFLSNEAKKESAIEMEKATYVEVDSRKLLNELDENAARAQKNYEGKHVEITGEIDNIDASLAYISILPDSDEFILTGFQFYINSDEVANTIVENYNTGDTITLKVKIISVGEIFGYQGDIFEIVK